jgi:hypothetical protein
MAEMFFSVYTNNSEANNRKSLIPLLSRGESFGGVFEKSQEHPYHGECFTKLELNSAGNISEEKKKKAFFLHSPTQIPLDRLTNNKK